MMEFVLGLVLGMIVGWNFLPQPKFMSDFFDRFKSK